MTMTPTLTPEELVRCRKAFEPWIFSERAEYRKRGIELSDGDANSMWIGFQAAWSAAQPHRVIGHVTIVKEDGTSAGAPIFYGQSDSGEMALNIKAGEDFTSYTIMYGVDGSYATPPKQPSSREDGE